MSEEDIIYRAMVHHLLRGLAPQEHWVYSPVFVAYTPAAQPGWVVCHEAHYPPVEVARRAYSRAVETAREWGLIA